MSKQYGCCHINPSNDYNTDVKRVIEKNTMTKLTLTAVRAMKKTQEHAYTQFLQVITSARATSFVYE